MPHLAFQLTDGNEFIFEILEDRLTIGRSTTNGVVLDKDFISNFHAELLKQPGGSYDWSTH
jgi:pSer/pThr/pTyr-binding forkhead associated (FHA) protein